MTNKKHSPTSLADVLKTQFSHLAKGKFQVTIDLQNKWPEIVGPLIAKRSKVLFFKDHLLTIGVENSTWLQELTLQKQTILEQLKDIFPLSGIKDIKLKIDSMR